MSGELIVPATQPGGAGWTDEEIKRYQDILNEQEKEKNRLRKMSWPIKKAKYNKKRR